MSTQTYEAWVDRARAVPLAFGRNDDEAIGARRRREDRRAAQGERLDLVIGQFTQELHVAAKLFLCDQAFQEGFEKAAEPTAGPSTALLRSSGRDDKRGVTQVKVITG